MLDRSPHRVDGNSRLRQATKFSAKGSRESDVAKQKALGLCFVNAPIGSDGSDVRRRSDQVLRHIIRPAVDECGYRAVRADEIAKPGLITSQVI